MIAIDDAFDLVRDIANGSSAMRLAEDRPAAPRAGIWTTARGDQRHRPGAVTLAPRSEIARNIDRLAIGIRLSIEVGQQVSRRRPHDLAIRRLEHDAIHRRKIAGARP